MRHQEEGEEGQGGERRPHRGAFRAAVVGVSTALLVISVVLLVADGGSWARGGVGAGGMLQGRSGVGELLQRDDGRRMIVAELLRRQNSIASIQKSLEAEEEQSKSVLLRLLAIDGNNTARGNETAIEDEENVDLPGNSTQNLRGANSTDALNVSDANSTGSGGESEGEEAATNRSAAPSPSASNTSSPASAIDEYAEARKMFARSNDTAEMNIALKEQPVTEYSNQTIRCYPTNDKGEIIEVEHSAAYCWYHPRYCQLMCERGPSREFAPAGAFNDPGSPEGNAWSMWKETLKNMGGVGV